MWKFKETSLAFSQNQWPEEVVVQYSMEYCKKDGKKELGQLAFKY